MQYVQRRLHLSVSEIRRSLATRPYVSSSPGTDSLEGRRPMSDVPEATAVPAVVPGPGFATRRTCGTPSITVILQAYEHFDARQPVSHEFHTIISRAVYNSSICPPGIGTVGFVEPLWDTIAFIQRESAVLSPATKEIARLARGMLLSRPDGSGFR